MTTQSKLQSVGARVDVNEAQAVALLGDIFTNSGCTSDTARMIAEHLADASLSGVESHGLMRVLQYVEQFETGYMAAGALPKVTQENGFTEVDGGGGSGIPAMHLAVETVVKTAKSAGIAALPVRNVGHTGRLGAFVQDAAQQGCMMFIIGGGNRQIWRQVAPYGGRKALLPTNPWAVGFPGGDQGPVVLDFATSKIAGGWIYAAQSAGAHLPEGKLIDKDGNPSTDPADYFTGGAILPAGGPKGYGLSVMAEMIGEALLGPVATECNWLMIALDTTRYRQPHAMQSVAEEVLAELRDCPPSPGFDKVQVPGERERALKKAADGKIAVPKATWDQIETLARRLQEARI